MIQKILDQLNSKDISSQKRKSLIRRLEKEGIRGQIISLPRNDTKEALAVIEYFEWRRRQQLGLLSRPHPSSADIEGWQETLDSGKASLESKKDALACLADQKDARILHFFKDYLEKSKGELKIWSRLAHDELIIWRQEERGTRSILLTKIDSKGRGLNNFNDQLLKFAPHYFCDHLCLSCFRKKDCSFWMENLKRSVNEQKLATPETERSWGQEALSTGLIFPENRNIQEGRQFASFFGQMRAVFESLFDFAEYFAGLTRKNFWLGPAFEAEMKNLLLYQAVFWEKIGLAASVYQAPRKNKKDFDTAYRAAALAYFILGFCQVLLGRIAQETSQPCFIQYLKTTQVIEDGRQAIARQFPLVRRFRDKIILNFPY